MIVERDQLLIIAGATAIALAMFVGFLIDRVMQLELDAAIIAEQLAKLKEPEQVPEQPPQKEC